MSTITPYCPPPPTWRLCHPVNIYVYQNGLEGERPTLVHIPMEKKKNMSTVLEAIGTRMKLPVGYPVGLYHMDGTRVCKTYELEMYNNYVVVTNLEKRFKCVDYGKIREPLVVIGSRYSKHVNTLRLQNKKFDLFCRRKMARKPLHELMANTGEQDGYGPGEIPGGKPCGQLCHKVTPRRDRVAQCCSDEIMCVEGAAMDLEGDRCRDYERAMEAEVQCEAPPGTKEDEDCKLVEELKEKVRQQSGEVRGGGGSLAGNLKDLMLRYRDVGSDIFKMFQDKICKDLEGEEGERRVSQRWEIPGGSNLSLETQQRLKEELIRLAGQSCQFAFDKSGNFVGSEGCKVPGGMSDAGVVTEESRAMEGMLEGMRRMSGGGGSRRASLQQTEGQGGGRRESLQGGGGERRTSNKQNEEEVGKRASFQEVEVGRLEVEMVDEENNISTGSIPGLTKVDSEKKVGEEEMEEEMRGKDNEEEMEVKKRVSGMQEEITEIVGNLRRSLVLSRSNSQNAGALPVGMASLAKEAKKLEAVLEEMEEEEEENSGEEEQQQVKQVKSTGSNKSGRSEKSGKSQGQGQSKRGSQRGGDQNEEEEEEEETNVFSLIMQSRNPWREGDMAGVGVPPLAGRLNKNRLDKLFSENPFRRYWFHEEEMFKDEPIKEEDPFLRKIQPPEEFNWPVPPPPSVPPQQQESDVFSVHGSRTEWWPNRQPDVFLQQINELVQRYDNTKATSPPPPPAPPEEEIPLNSKLFTVGPSPRRNVKKSVACGQSKTEVKSPPKHRNVCAQAGEGASSPPEVNYDNNRKEKMVEELWPKKNYSGGTQTRIILKELPSEDEKPAGMYEGYQESIKSHLSEEENDGDDERRVYYRKRREKMHKGILKPSGRRRLKRKEHFLHPCTVYSPDEEELQEEDDKQLSPRGGDNKQQGVQWLISTNPGGYPQVYLTQGLQNTQFGGQQPFLVQTTPAPGTTFPVIARHSTEVTPAPVLKPGGVQLPLVQFTQQQSSSSSPLLRQPIIYTGSSPQQKYLPMINPNMRLVRLVQAPQQFQQQQSVTTSSLISTGPPQGPLQNKLVQMMMTPPQLQSLVLQQQQQLTQPSPQQFIFKPQ